MSTVLKDREIGFVVAVTNIRVTVELHQEVKSAVRSYPGGLSTVAQIGAYLMFPLGAGEWAVGTIVGAFENESYEPDPGEGMTLQLAKPRRTLRVNLLGTVCARRGLGDDEQATMRPHFRRGIAIYPVLETPAIIPTEDELQAILTDVVSWRMEEELPRTLHVGQSPIYPRVEVRADYDDLFARPLAIVGNTGSGKSWTVASLLQRTLSAEDASGARIIILDINGEYWKAFAQPQIQRKPDEAYVNGRPFALPLWSLNLRELTHVFQVTEATQAQLPVLERMITFARQFSSLGSEADELFECLSLLARVRNATQGMNEIATAQGNKPYSGRNARTFLRRMQADCSALHGREPIGNRIHADFFTAVAGAALVSEDGSGVLVQQDVESILKLLQAVDTHLESLEVDLATSSGMVRATADSPLPFDYRLLAEEKTRRWVFLGFEGEAEVRRHLPTLFLRIHRWVSDARWNSLKGVDTEQIESVARMLVGESEEQLRNATIIDCSMIAYDVLPFFCACVGRLLLDVRRHANHDQRTLQPWVLVLEEAHNYLRPHRREEELGVALSREAFERVAKEGRKFGLSLVVASQRPRDVSDTVLSQCANFIVHRIQNPEDIDYFRRIVPVGSREMLDQVPILAAGEGLLLGSAVNVPSRVQIAKPDPPPSSDTPKPSAAWRTGQQQFEIKAAVANWLREVSETGPSGEDAPPNEEEEGQEQIE